MGSYSRSISSLMVDNWRKVGCLMKTWWLCVVSDVPGKVSCHWTGLLRTYRVVVEVVLLLVLLMVVVFWCRFEIL